MEKQKKRLKKSKKDKEVWCSDCCQMVPVKWPHSCYDYVYAVARDIYYQLVSIETGVKLLRSIAAKGRHYVDFSTGE